MNSPAEVARFVTFIREPFPERSVQMHRLLLLFPSLGNIMTGLRGKLGLPAP